jgi:transglutaminase-like putative cysteine protease
MRRSIPSWASLLVAALLAGTALPGPAAAAQPDRNSKPRSRTFLFTYAATVTDLPPGKLARIWVPVPPVNDQQDVALVSKTLPGEARLGRDPTYGNLILSVEAKADAAGKVPLQLTYRVTRHEVRTDAREGIAKHEAAKTIARFLQPDAKVPITGKPLDLLKDKTVPMDQLVASRVFYDVVNKHMTYAKDTPGWGQGDAVFACTSGRGNCSDFHSLFISLARAHKIPAKFEMGFPIPEKRGEGDIAGYHCWAWFLPKSKGWIPVDISEANKNPSMAEYYFGNLTEDRVMLSTGRDITLAPRQQGGPLNFFVYPYVEVDGQPHPPKKVETKFSYKDVPADKG